MAEKRITPKAPEDEKTSAAGVTKQAKKLSMKKKAVIVHAKKK